ncbi:Uncharacterised protein [Actinomyces bovis]|uniref:Phage protein n=1 Tax=Actinomyces bovis TaxID=1658 RepID=A0ABY1VPS2_9ACTO|nr:Uncharacterised protein [Actinomyces bovis]VEG53158.1 Uncharacterised protein [Actinomyces israelii]
MSTSVRFEFSSEGFQQVLNSEGVKARLQRMGEAVAAEAGDGFETNLYQANYGGSPRPMIVVRAATMHARLAEARDKALTRALSAASRA